MQIEHEVQLTILKQLLYHPKARFRDLNKSDLTNDHFTFHLNRLIKLGVIRKVDNRYELTLQGLEIAGRLDLKTMKVIRQPKMGILLCITRMKNKVREVLLEERLRDPYRGRVGFHTEKIRFGESFFETAKRCLKKETGLVGQFEYVGAVRMLRMKDGYPVIDVLLNYMRVSNISGTLIPKIPESRNFWLPYEEAYKLKTIYPQFDKDLDYFKNAKKLFFEERMAEY